jgi:hypothetical protein
MQLSNLWHTVLKIFKVCQGNKSPKQREYLTQLPIKRHTALNIQQLLLGTNYDFSKSKRSSLNAFVCFPAFSKFQNHRRAACQPKNSHGTKPPSHPLPPPALPTTKRATIHLRQKRTPTV